MNLIVAPPKGTQIAASLLDTLNEVIQRSGIQATIQEKNGEIHVESSSMTLLEQRFLARILKRAGYDILIPV
jgi:H2-forming N5,N10-methylenetetrahydromethanopterin dehydrogenase-like enzyme